MTARETEMEERLNVVERNGDDFLDSDRPPSAAVEEQDKKLDSKLSQISQLLPAERQLRERVKAAECRTDNDDRPSIFPIRSLHKALRKDLIERCLRDLGQDKKRARKNAEEIFSRYCRVMGALARTGVVSSIQTFMKLGLDDTRLPLTEADEWDCLFTKEKEKVTFPGWGMDEYQGFARNQKACLTPFLAPSPNGGMNHYMPAIPSRYLPIVQRGKSVRRGSQSPPSDGEKHIVYTKQENMEGAQGVVIPIKLHPHSCDFDGIPFQRKDGFLAMKERVHSTQRIEFLREVYVWITCNDKRKGGLRICPLLCTIETEENDQTQYRLIFPLAEGPLTALWSAFPLGRGDARLTPQWLAGELAALAETLAVVHHGTDYEKATPQKQALFGRFGDVKPSNILHFRDDATSGAVGSLVFSDLGLAKVHRNVTLSNSVAADTRHSLTYKAPEFEYLDRGIGRCADIWGFGCTLLQHLTWYIMGHDPITRTSTAYNLVRALFPDFDTDDDSRADIEPRADSWVPVDLFDDLRDEVVQKTYSQDMFYTKDVIAGQPGRVTLRPSVVCWIKVLHEHERCSPFLHELLAFIQTRMLHVHNEERATADEVHKRFAKLDSRLKTDDHFGKSCGRHRNCHTPPAAVYHPVA